MDIRALGFAHSQANIAEIKYLQVKKVLPSMEK
jgi:hypothetical protein